MKNKSIYEPYIPARLNKFFNKHIKVINLIFNILQKYKPNIIDCFSYSVKNPPPHPLYKYTDKLYLGCIFYVIYYGSTYEKRIVTQFLFLVGYASTWESFIGPIPGKQLNKRHHEYIRYGLYSDFYNSCLKTYLKKNDVKYLSIDSSIINNKGCNELKKHLPINKNRKGVKINAIVDDIGSPLIYSINESTIHDSKIGYKDIQKLSTNKIINNILKKVKGAANKYRLVDIYFRSLRDKLSEDIHIY